MNIIIDTHIFLWLAVGDYKEIRKLDYLEDPNNNLYLSSLSIAEILIKVSIGKLRFDGDIMDVLQDMGVDVLDFDGKSALLLKMLPMHHRDPFDRMIISQAIANHYHIYSNDSKFELYDCKLL